MNDASTFSGFKTSSKLLMHIIIVNELHSPSLTSSSGNNIHAPNVSFKHEDDAKLNVTIPSLECVRELVAKKEKNLYTVMLPTSAGANSKSYTTLLVYAH